MSSVDVINVEGNKAGSVELPDSVFDVQANIPLMHQVVVAQLAAARQGTHSTKRRGEVSCRGAKPFKHFLQYAILVDAQTTVIHLRLRMAITKMKGAAQQVVRCAAGNPISGLFRRNDLNDPAIIALEQIIVA